MNLITLFDTIGSSRHAAYRDEPTVHTAAFEVLTEVTGNVVIGQFLQRSEVQGKSENKVPYFIATK
jgi:hypothetical protein